MNSLVNPKATCWIGAILVFALIPTSESWSQTASNFDAKADSLPGNEMGIPNSKTYFDSGTILEKFDAIAKETRKPKGRWFFG